MRRGPTGPGRRRTRGAPPRSPRRSTGCSCWTARSAHYGGHVLGGFLGRARRRGREARAARAEIPRAPGGRRTPASEARVSRTWPRAGTATTRRSTSRRPEGQAIFRQLAARADVVIEGFPPGRMDAWGHRVPPARAAESPARLRRALDPRAVRTAGRGQRARVRPDRPGALGPRVHHRRARATAGRRPGRPASGAGSAPTPRPRGRAWPRWPRSTGGRPPGAAR